MSTLERKSDSFASILGLAVNVGLGHSFVKLGPRLQFWLDSVPDITSPQFSQSVLEKPRGSGLGAVPGSQCYLSAFANAFQNSVDESAQYNEICRQHGNGYKHNNSSIQEKQPNSMKYDMSFIAFVQAVFENQSIPKDQVPSMLGCNTQICSILFRLSEYCVVGDHILYLVRQAYDKDVSSDISQAVLYLRAFKHCDTGLASLLSVIGTENTLLSPILNEGKGLQNSLVSVLRSISSEIEQLCTKQYSDMLQPLAIAEMGMLFTRKINAGVLELELSVPYTRDIADTDVKRHFLPRSLFDMVDKSILLHFYKRFAPAYPFHSSEDVYIAQNDQFIPLDQPNGALFVCLSLLLRESGGYMSRKDLPLQASLVYKGNSCGIQEYDLWAYVVTYQKSQCVAFTPVCTSQPPIEAFSYVWNECMSSGITVLTNQVIPTLYTRASAHRYTVYTQYKRIYEQCILKSGYFDFSKLLSLQQFVPILACTLPSSLPVCKLTRDCYTYILQGKYPHYSSHNSHNINNNNNTYSLSSTLHTMSIVETIPDTLRQEKIPTVDCDEAGDWTGCDKHTSKLQMATLLFQHHKDSPFCMSDAIYRYLAQFYKLVRRPLLVKTPRTLLLPYFFEKSDTTNACHSVRQLNQVFQYDAVPESMKFPKITGLKQWLSEISEDKGSGVSLRSSLMQAAQTTLHSCIRREDVHKKKFAQWKEIFPQLGELQVVTRMQKDTIYMALGCKHIGVFRVAKVDKTKLTIKEEYPEFERNSRNILYCVNAGGSSRLPLIMLWKNGMWLWIPSLHMNSDLSQ